MTEEGVVDALADEPPVPAPPPYTGPSYGEITSRRDALGRSDLHKIQPLALMHAMPWILAGFDRQVPDGMWTEDAEDGYAMALIPCPCGEEVKVRLAHVEECACGRFYFHAGQRVKVGGDPSTAVAS